MATDSPGGSVLHLENVESWYSTLVLCLFLTLAYRFQIAGYRDVHEYRDVKQKEPVSWLFHFPSYYVGSLAGYTGLKTSRMTFRVLLPGSLNLKLKLLLTPYQSKQEPLWEKNFLFSFLLNEQTREYNP